MPPKRTLELDTRHRLALLAGDVGLWSWDANANTVDWDERTRNALGAWPAKVTTADYDAAIHPEDLPRKQAAWHAALNPAGDGSYQAEYRLRRPDTGEIRWIASNARCVFENGKPQRVVGVLRDITEVRTSEAALRRLASQMAGIVSLAADAIITIDAAMRITLFNHGAENIFGYAQDEVVGQPLDILLPEAARMTHNRHVAAFGQSGVTARRMGERREITGRRKSGQIFFADASISKLETNGEVFYTAVLRDVTERREAQRLILHSKQVLEVALDVGKIGLFEHDYASATVFWSPLLRSMLGVGESEPGSIDLYRSLIPADAIAPFDAAVRATLDATGSGSLFAEHPIVDRQGTTRWLSVRGQTTFLNGKPERTIGAVADITERKLTQAVLEEKIEASTRELKLEMKRREESQAQLVRTQRMEAFGQLTGGIAHDFNNLLTVITGNLELLEMRVEDEKQRALLKRAQDSAEMGARLTGRLLTFARRRHYEATALNINEVVIDLAELLESTLGEPITVTTILERNAWTVVADASEIENAILNLAINARDAMPAGGRLVIETSNITIADETVAAATKLVPGAYVRLSISDTGFGMSNAVLQKAFEPFFTTKEPGKGTGLGLSTIYGFVQQAGGAVTIYSEQGTGTTVNIYLPRAEQVSAEEPAAASPAAVTPMSAGERVLLVEDNPDVRMVAHSQLELLGYKIIEASNGPAAIEILNGGEPVDIVFSDVVMSGGMSGFDVVNWLRAHRPDCRFLLASGYPDEVLRLQGVNNKHLEILRKPYSRHELAVALRQVLDA